MTNNITPRKSNIELLRIIASMFVIFLHYINGGIGGGNSFVSGTINVFLMRIYQAVAFCAVDLFIMISGYFLCTTEKRKISKIILLCIQASIFSLSHYLITCISGSATLSSIGIIKSLMALGYFIVLYSVTYILSPLINIVINCHTDSSSLKRTTLILFTVFSLLSSIIDILSSFNIMGIDWNGMSTISNLGSIEGYTIVNLFLCYFIGAYIRKTDTALKKTSLLKILLISILALTTWGYIDWKSAYTYNNPFVILNGAVIFCIFLKINIKSSLINELSKSTFSCYLAHAYFFNFLHIEFHVKCGSIIFTLHMLASAILLYLICHLIYWIYLILTAKLTRYLSSVIDRTIKIQYIK